MINPLHIYFVKWIKGIYYPFITRYAIEVSVEFTYSKTKIFCTINE